MLDSLESALQLPPNEVIELDLRDKNLAELPAELYHFTHLKTLLLGHNEITQLSPEIEHFQSLEILDLSNNKLETLPDVFWRLTSLLELDLSENQLGLHIATSDSLANGFSRLEKLHTLHLEKNQLAYLPVGINRLPQLQVLTLLGNQFTAFPPLHLPHLTTLSLEYNQLRELDLTQSFLPALEELYLNANPLESLSHTIAQLVSLRRLALYHTQIKQFPSELKDLTNLRELGLGFINLQQVPEEIFSLTNLEWLDLRNTGITELPADIANLKQLQRLDLQNNALFLLPTELEHLSDLKWLDISGNIFPPGLAEPLQDFLPDTKIKFVDMRRVYANILDGLSEIQQRHNIDEAAIAHFVHDIIRQKPLPEAITRDNVAMIVLNTLHWLMFERGPEIYQNTIVLAPMMTDLVKGGQQTWKEVIEFLVLCEEEAGTLDD